MGYFKKMPVAQVAAPSFTLPEIKLHKVDWPRLVSLDFETKYDADYTLTKLSTSEYIRDPRFEALMCGIKIGRRKTVVVPGPKIKAYLAKIDWSTHSVLAHNCVPGDTEVLTRSGWKRIDEADSTQEIMQWDPTTERLGWCTPLAKVQHAGTELLRWDTQFHRAAYTPGHRMYYSTPDRSDWRVGTAEEVAAKGQNNVFIPVAGIYDAPEIELSEDEARLMEAIRADGSWTLDRGKCYGARFRLHKERKIARLQALCDSLGVELKQNDKSFRICKHPLLTRMFELLGAGKEYGQWVLSLPVVARKAILEELVHWDGHDRGMSKGFSWSCADRQTVEAVELLAHTTGWSVSGTWRSNARGFSAHNPDAELFTGTVRDRAKVKLVRGPVRTNSAEDVFCFTVPTGAFMIRANGRVCITGNCQFDGFILSHHYKIVPKTYYCTLSMARGLHSNEIGAGLDEVAKFYGRAGKIEGGVEGMKGLGYKELVAQKKYAAGAEYCGRDVDEMFGIFEEMVKVFPDDEMRLVDLTCRMFNDPVLCVNLPRVEAELARELEARREMLTTTVREADYAADINKILKTKAERELTGDARLQLITRRVVGSNERFADLLRAEGVEPPRKISPAWMKKPAHERLDEDKWSYAFAKDDLDFTSIPDDVDALAVGLDLNKKADVKKLAAKQARLRQLVDCRIAVKSTTNITRAQRFLAAGAGGMRLPVGYAYARAHTLRFGGNNKMNMQNLTRGGELRLSIEAPKGHVLNVVDSGQIEARFSAWMWEQEDLLAAFLAADTWDKARGVAHGDDRDAYCKFADSVYNFEVTTDNKTERFVGKVCIAEGQPVLTARGLVPIEEIRIEDRLWDGVEWVHHAGVIDQGIREVITYDGLTATPDHEVFTVCGRVLPLGQAASEMARLQRTGVDGQAIRFCDAHVAADTPRKRLSVRVGEVFRDGHDEADVPRQPTEREDDFVLGEWAPAGEARGSTGPAIRRDQSAVLEPNEPWVEGLRRAGHQVPVHEPDGVHPVGVEEPAPRELCGGGDRPSQQRRALRAEESSLGDQDRAGQEPAEYLEDRRHANGRLAEPILPVGNIAHGKGGDERNTNHPGSSAGGSAQAQELAGDCRMARTYDIANAGPRYRYTVSGALILNCVLGLGYQMGPAKLQITLAKGALGGPPVFFTLDECKKIVNTYRLKNYKIAAGWKICDRIIGDMAAGREGSHKCISWGKDTIYLPNGLTLKYPQLRKAMGDKGWEEWSYQSGDQRKKIYGGLLAENLSQCLCRIIITEQMLAANAKYRVVMMTHDEIVILSKKAQAGAAQRFLEKVMKTSPAWCADIPLNCEGGYAENYSK